jgi:predicted Zn-dependent peptidase
MMYPNHPYAHPILGTEETVTPLMATDLRQYHHDYFRPDNMVVSVSGRLAPDDAIALIDKYLGDWQPPQHEGQPVSLSQPEVSSITPQSATSMIPEDTQQSVIMLGYLCASVQSDDYLVLKLLNTYLGNGLSSRLFVELREKRGLAYEVSAFYPTRVHQSQFVAYMGTAPVNTQQALDGLQQEVTRLASTLLEPEALQAAKNKLLGQYALGKQTNAQLAQIFGWYETLGLGLAFDQQFQDGIGAITPEQAQSVAKRYFTEPYISIVGQPIAANALSA